MTQRRPGIDRRTELGMPRLSAEIAALRERLPADRRGVDNILGKLGVHSRVEAVDLARAAGLLADGPARSI